MHILLAGIFVFAYFVPFGSARVSAAVQESFLMLSEYAQQHVLLCLDPAFFIAGAIMIGILVFINWAPSQGASSGWDAIYRAKYIITGGFALVLLYSLVRWFKRSELTDWVRATRDFAVQILPLLFGGVMVAGFLLGRPGHMALIPERWIASLVGGNSLGANLIASVSGALMYFATLTEVPIMQGLLGAGMGQGPALALLLAGPSLSLPSMLVISGEIGWKKTLVYVGLVVVLSTAVGMAFGSIVA